MKNIILLWYFQFVELHGTLKSRFLTLFPRNSTPDDENVDYDYDIECSSSCDGEVNSGDENDSWVVICSSVFCT